MKNVDVMMPSEYALYKKFGERVAILNSRIAQEIR